MPYDEHIAEDVIKSDAADIDPVATYVLDELYDEFSRSTYREKKVEEAKKNRKEYDGHRPDKAEPWPGCANYSMMVPAIVVDNIEPRLVGSVIGQERDVVEVTANSSGSEKNVKAVEQFLEWALPKRCNWGTSIPNWIHDLLLDGTVFILPRYVEEEVTQGQRYIGQVLIDPTTEEEIRDEAQLRELMVQGVQPTVKMVDEIREKQEVVWKVVNELITMERVYGPDEIEDWDTCPSLWKSWYRYEDLQEQSEDNGGPYINITDALKAEESETRDENDMSPDADRTSVEPERTRKTIECINCFCRYDLGEGRDWCYLTVTTETKTVIRKQYLRKAYPANRKPLRRLMLFGDGKKQFGTGAPHKIRHHAHAINDCLNQMIDSGTVQINPWYLYSDAAGLPDEVDLRPGMGSRITGSAKDVVFPNLGVKAQIYIEFINLIVSYLERLIAVSSYSAGVEDSTMGQGAGTSSGMRMMLQEAQIKHSYQAKPIKEQLAEVIKEDFMLLSYYMPLDAMMESPGGEGFQAINVQDLQGDYSISIRVSDTAQNDMLQRMEAVELFELAAKLPFVNQAVMFTELLETYERKNPQRYIDPNFLFVLQACTANPEIAQVIQQYMQQKAQQQHMGELQQGVQDGIIRGDMKNRMMEPRKIQDMVSDVKDTLIKRHIMDIAEKQKIKEMHPELISDEDLEDAVRGVRKRQAKDFVEAYLEPGVDDG